MLPKKTLLIFDLDGTLFNTLGDLSIAVNYALHQFNFPEHNKETIRSFIGNGSMKLIERSMGVFATAENVKRTNISVEKVHKVFSEFYWNNCTQNTIPNPGIIDFLKQNKNAYIAMLTNKPFAPATKILKHFGIHHYFDCILCGDTTPERKPSPAGILEILNNLNIPKEHAIMIGDDLPDILSARNAGIDCLTLFCGFGKPHNLKPSNPQNIVYSYEELCFMLKKIT